MMKSLKKYAIFMIFLLLLSSCGNQKISLPKSKDLEYIKVIEVDKKTKSEKEVIKIEKEEDVKIFIDSVSSATKIKKESISDEPTNIEKYLKVSFYHKEAKNSPSIMYIYKSRDYTEEKYFYFEQPYTGVFRIKKIK
ncbi:conserved domain protein [Parvimonas sp. oral taxon 393 str. F0440]|nr:conserved domain protein [Parvimonas sp. oral taxon 393 str. F0440]